MSQSNKLELPFGFVGSTGRTATTFIARFMNSIDGVLGLHEGTIDNKSIGTGVLPEINIENRAAYSSSSRAMDVVAEKRSQAILAAALKQSEQNQLVDVAYYNATICEALLETHENSRFVGIIRDCGAFVMSSTTLEGEDPLPVGWPAPEKKLTDRERFIAMGRIKPGRGHPDKERWSSFSAIKRNIWLWHETNLSLIMGKSKFPDRVTLLPFEDIRCDPDAFWSALGRGLGLKNPLPPPDPMQNEGKNKKAFGYQLPPVEEWGQDELYALKKASDDIEKKAIFYV